MVKVLEKAGCTVTYNDNQTCCGQPAFNAGFWGEAKDVCTKFLKDFSGSDYIVAPSASCVGFVRNYYEKIFENTTDNISWKKNFAAHLRIFRIPGESAQSRRPRRQPQRQSHLPR
jgi:L-lactate dehydrogenase complex protein LldE